MLSDDCRVKSRETLVIVTNHAFYLPDNQPGQMQSMVAFSNEFSLYNTILGKGSGYGMELLGAVNRADAVHIATANELIDFK